MSNVTRVSNVTLKHEGTQIILPVLNGKEMSPAEAIVWLDRKMKEEEIVVSVHEEIPCSPLDGAVAFHKAIAKRYGFSSTGYGTTLVGVPVSTTEKEQVPWGSLQIPGIDGKLSTGLKTHPTPCFIVSGQIKRKHEKEVKAIVELTREILSTESIYQGKAVRVSWDWERSDRSFDPLSDAPRFFDVDPDAERILTFGERVSAKLERGLFAFIDHLDACRRFAVPRKRGVLLYGKYGTGKTLTASVAAIRAERAGVTFIYLDSVHDLRRGLEFAQAYSPAVIFCEDIDQVMGSRSGEMNEVLNLLDGIDTKGKEVITVFTTNHVEKIDPAFLRMGRVDTLIEVLPPDASAAGKLVKLYGRELLSPDTNYIKVGQRLQGKIPAFIRECVELSKTAAIVRLNGGDITGKVMEADLLAAADDLESHDAFLAPKVVSEEFKAVDKFFVRALANGKMPVELQGSLN